MPSSWKTKTATRVWRNGHTPTGARRAWPSGAIDGDSLLETLYPGYIRKVPNFDGWGLDYEYRHASSIVSPRYMAIRSAGRDGAFEGDVYKIGPFPQTDYDRDIVWADGFFVQYPGPPPH